MTSDARSRGIDARIDHRHQLTAARASPSRLRRRLPPPRLRTPQWEDAKCEVDGGRWAVVAYALQVAGCGLRVAACGVRVGVRDGDRGLPGQEGSGGWDCGVPRECEPSERDEDEGWALPWRRYTEVLVWATQSSGASNGRGSKSDQGVDCA